MVFNFSKLLWSEFGNLIKYIKLIYEEFNLNLWYVVGTMIIISLTYKYILSPFITGSGSDPVTRTVSHQRSKQRRSDRGNHVD